ncbi:MAG: ABC transporter substrate-binding protein [Magnetovibrio sp.]|nr:ABC transporter substrate-binding protein [Magnetovibrio sp.]
MANLKSALFAVSAVLYAALVPLNTMAQEVQPTHAIAMHGSPKYGADFKYFEYVNPDAPKGGTIRFASFGSFDSFNGFISKGETVDGIGNIYDTLTTSSADEAFTQYGVLAQSIEVPEDRSWVIFNLRAEAKWHDGMPITAADVKWTYETLIDKGAPQYKFYYADVAKVEVLSERSVKFTFSTTENRELPLILGQLAILPKHYWQSRDFSKTTLEPPLGSGPYKIGKFETGRSITYERIADYWGRDLPANVGHNNFGKMRYEYFRDGQIQVEA